MTHLARIGNLSAEDHITRTQQVSKALSGLATELLRSSADTVLQIMRRHDLSMPRVVALMYVDRLGAATITDIKEHLNLSLGTTSHIVDQLVENGYVSRVEDPSDRRCKQVALTEQGHRLVGEVRQARVEELSRRLAEMPDEQLERALETLQAVNTR
jgi:DNA-binding MarR family transcriptional regulator